MRDPYFEAPGVTIYHADSRDLMHEMRTAGMKVDAVVTSPPYADARKDYSHAASADYVEWIDPFLKLMWQVLTPSGALMLNLGRVFRDHVELDYAERTLLRAQKIGFRRIDTIIWCKVNGRPINPYLTNVHETVYWLAKEPGKAYRGFDETRAPYAPETLLRYQRRWTNHANQKESGDPRDVAVQEGRTAHPDGARPRSVYVTQVGKEKKRKHPAPMALELARFLVCLSCPPGGTVLDPFFGGGTTGRAARLHGRGCVGVEEQEKWLVEAVAMLSQLPMDAISLG